MSPPWKFQEIFPARLVIKKMGQIGRFARCLPHENFWKLTGMVTKDLFQVSGHFFHSATVQAPGLNPTGSTVPILKYAAGTHTAPMVTRNLFSLPE